MYEEKVSLERRVFSILILALIFSLVIKSFLELDYAWDYKSIVSFFWNNGPSMILEGLWCTVWISLVSIIFGSLTGIVVGLCLLSKDVICRWFAIVYVDVFRNTPLLVQLYLCFFILGTLLDLSAKQAGVLSLSLFCSAYVAEIVRGTLAQFEQGQIDAAKSLGFTKTQTAFYVVAPQALKRMMPPLIGQFVSLVKDSSLVSVIGIMDLTKSASNAVSISFRSFEIWFLIAIIYLFINMVFSTFGRFLEVKLGN